MNNIINKIKNIEWFSKLIIALVSMFAATIWWFFSAYNNFKVQNEELLKRLKIAEQLALKSIIWNDSIPIVERASACDLYLANGYNSLTKKECENIIVVFD